MAQDTLTQVNLQSLAAQALAQTIAQINNQLGIQDTYDLTDVGITNN